MYWSSIVPSQCDFKLIRKILDQITYPEMVLGKYLLCFMLRVCVFAWISKDSLIDECRLCRGSLRLEEGSGLAVPEALVGAARAAELGVGAVLHDGAVLEHHDTLEQRCAA